MDIIWFIPTFVLAIVCALREASLTNPNNINAQNINAGAFAVSAVKFKTIFNF
jgi:hypothetical protein